MRSRAVSAVGSMLVVMAGCATPHIDAPAGFLTLTGSDSKSQRITSADGAKLWVRAFDDPARGSLEFWSKAVEHEFVTQRGYELVRNDEVKDSAGRRGVAFEFRSFAAGQPHGYLLALFVHGGTLRTVEFAAPREVFDAHIAAVRSALPSVR